MERESPAITLGPVNATDIGRMSPLAAPFAEQIAAASGGVLALTAAAVERLGDPDPLQSALRAIDTRVDELLRRLSPMAQAAVLLMSLNPGIGASDVAAALALPDAADLVDEALASGLIAGPGHVAFAARVHGCAARLLGAARHLDLERSLLRTQLEMGSVSADLALALVGHGLRDLEVARLLSNWATTESDPLSAADLYRAALTAGAEPDPIRVPLAESLARAGDLAAAAAQADEVLASTDPAQRTAGVRVAAAIACHNGDSGQAAAL